jgi:hypothetical protein
MRKVFMLFLLILLSCGRAGDVAVVGAGAAQSDSQSQFDGRPTRHRIEADLRVENNAKLADDAFDEMFHVASQEMAAVGDTAHAAQLQAEWNGIYKGMLIAQANGLMGDTGDHAPLSVWVEQWYSIIALVLGPTVMERTHLEDIWVLNYTIPVVFHPQQNTLWCSETLNMNLGDTCEAEYRRHFAGTEFQIQPDPYAKLPLHQGFSSVVTYWGVMIGCEIATYGTGWFVICSPIATIAEDAVDRFLAPRLSDDIWMRHNPS